MFQMNPEAAAVFHDVSSFGELISVNLFKKFKK